ncbi:S1C family serine protease [Piscinibacter gummiphilus]|uniref:Trypsin-like peptidase domain-containing protein n=1 Tax=Piscinibacter gummiphilus TaxID=946333 RepID=A0ABZ0D5L1_9BURK|nr:trypsin-like peptidase domain-containing protein [Piscinibacter gummiphilus]WOB09959.1 trypsin-like peptidase domain-containing protein [Piscinibacter gummiphilus]
MRKAPLYSRSPRQPSPPATAAAVRPAPDMSASAAAPVAPRKRSAWRERLAWATVGVLLVVLGAFGQRAFAPGSAALTQKDIDASVRRSLEKEPLPSAYAKAHAAIAPSVVRVEGDDGPDDAPAPQAAPGGKSTKKKTENGPPVPNHAIGTGVVIVDNGTILTNLHVVAGSKRLKVTFADGSESDASLIGVQPEHDLAVLRARSIPDDLVAATMRSTADLQPGDEVIAVGFPFGIGPSVSGGVVSGLRREFRSPQGQRKLTNLIQFDAAANPGNSGGPLVTMDGSVVGIVTAILNPSEQRTFIGIGFAVPIENAAAAAGMPPF